MNIKNRLKPFSAQLCKKLKINQVTWSDSKLHPTEQTIKKNPALKPVLNRLTALKNSKKDNR